MHTRQAQSSNAARTLLHKHGASVTLTVRAYPTGAAGTALASASVRGKP